MVPYTNLSSLHWFRKFDPRDRYGTLHIILYRNEKLCMLAVVSLSLSYRFLKAKIMLLNIAVS